MQLRLIEEQYALGNYSREIYDPSHSSQKAAHERLQGQGLDIQNLKDLGKGWSICWSSKEKNKKRESTERILLQW